MRTRTIGAVSVISVGVYFRCIILCTICHDSFNQAPRRKKRCSSFSKRAYTRARTYAHADGVFRRAGAWPPFLKYIYAGMNEDFLVSFIRLIRSSDEILYPAFPSVCAYALSRRRFGDDASSRRLILSRTIVNVLARYNCACTIACVRIERYSHRRFAREHFSS